MLQDALDNVWKAHQTLGGEPYPQARMQHLLIVFGTLLVRFMQVSGSGLSWSGHFCRASHMCALGCGCGWGGLLFPARGELGEGHVGACYASWEPCVSQRSGFCLSVTTLPPPRCPREC